MTLVAMAARGRRGRPATAPTFPDPPPLPGSGFVVDFGALPDAARQENDWAWYRSTVKDAPAGTVYTDPHSGVAVLKLTDATTPEANTQAWHAYSEGGPQMSQGWGDEGLNATVYLNVVGAGWRLADCLYNRGGNPSVTNWRTPVRNGGELRWAFSRNPDTPQYAYTIVSGTIYRLNWVTNEQADGGIFPYVMPDQGTYGSVFNWLELSADDRYLNFQTADTTWHFRLDAATASLLARDKDWLGVRAGGDPNANETHITDDGRYCLVVISSSRCRWWDCETDKRSADFLGFYHSHGARTRDTMVSANTENPERGWNVGIPLGPITDDDQSPPSPFAEQFGTGVDAIVGWHHSRHLDMPGGRDDQWFVTCGTGPDGLRPVSASNLSAWEHESGSIYRASRLDLTARDRERGHVVWELSGAAPADLIRTYARVPFVIDLATTLLTMAEGTCYWHEATSTLYVWPVGGGAPTGAHYVMVQSANHGALGVSAVGAARGKYVCHTYAIGDVPGLSPNNTFRYRACPMPHLGPAPWILFKSEHGAPNQAGARIDTFMARLPVAEVS